MKIRDEVVRRSVLACVAAAMLAGCAAPRKSVDVGALERSKPKTLLLVLIPNKSFMGPYLSRIPVSGVIAASIAAGIRGNAIMEEHHLLDPGTHVGTVLATRLAARYSVPFWTISEAAPEPTGRGRTPVARPPRPATDLALEIHTSYWGVEASGWNDAEAWVEYSVEATLRDNRTHSVVATGTCGSPLGKRATRKPSYAALSDDGPTLKSELAAAADHCIDHIARELLLLPDAPPAHVAAALPTSTPDGGSPSSPLPPDGGIEVNEGGASPPSTPPAPVRQQIDTE